MTFLLPQPSYAISIYVCNGIPDKTKYSKCGRYISFVRKLFNQMHWNDTFIFISDMFKFQSFLSLLSFILQDISAKGCFLTVPYVQRVSFCHQKKLGKSKEIFLLSLFWCHNSTVTKFFAEYVIKYSNVINVCVSFVMYSIALMIHDTIYFLFYIKRYK